MVKFLRGVWSPPHLSNTWSGGNQSQRQKISPPSILVLVGWRRAQAMPQRSCDDARPRFRGRGDKATGGSILFVFPEKVNRIVCSRKQNCMLQDRIVCSRKPNCMLQTFSFFRIVCSKHLQKFLPGDLNANRFILHLAELYSLEKCLPTRSSLGIGLDFFFFR